MIGCLRTRVHKQPIIALYFETDNELKDYGSDVLFGMIWVQTVCKDRQHSTHRWQAKTLVGLFQ